MAINRTIFYNLVRANPFGGRLTQQNVDGTNAILDAWEKEYSDRDINGLGYILATAFGETGTMKWDVNEYGGNSYFTRMYDIKGSRPSKARELGNTTPGDGAKYHGRSFPQITGKANYAKMTKLLQDRFPGIDLVKNPDRALEKDVGSAILMKGMYGGHFTGKKLSDYFDGKVHSESEMKRRRIEARRIINGTDKAEMFARVAAAFTMALKAAMAPASVLETVQKTGKVPYNGVEAMMVAENTGEAAGDTTTEATEPVAFHGGLITADDPARSGRARPVSPIPQILEDLAPTVISAAIAEALGGARPSIPVDKKDSILSSVIIQGSALAGVPGIITALTAIQDRWVALAVVGVIVVGIALVVTGRIKISHDAGV